MEEQNKNSVSADEDQVVFQQKDLVDSQVIFVGDKTTICQVVQLLAYIRHAIQNNMKTDIKVKIGYNITNSDFMFSVNGLQIPDFRTQDEAEIN